MSEHKKHIASFLKRAAAFAVFIALFYAAAVSVWVEVMPADYSPNVFYRIASYGHTLSRLKEAKNTRDADVLFLGSSHAYRGFDTRIFRRAGYNVFNLGSGSQTPAQTRVLLDRYYDKLNPKVVVWAVDPYAVTSDGVESALDVISNDKTDISSLRMTLETAHPKVWNTFIYAACRNLFRLDANLVEDPVKAEDLYIPGGFVQKELKRFKHTAQPPEEIDFNERMMHILSEEARKIQSSGASLFLVRTPVTAAFYDAYTNNSEFTRRMEEIAPYHDFNGTLPLNDSLHFYDKHHMNQEGVEIFNEAVLEWLEAQRLRGAEAQWHRGSEAQKHRGTEAQRHRSTEAQKHRGTEAQWRRGSEAQRLRGTEAQRHRAQGSEAQ